MSLHIPINNKNWTFECPVASDGATDCAVATIIEKIKSE